MTKPTLELTLQAIPGSGITDTALSMANLARATGCVIVCEFQPGFLLTAHPEDAAEDIAKQFTDRPLAPGKTSRADRAGGMKNEWEARRARTMDRFQTHVGHIANEIAEIRGLFQQWGGH